MKTKSIHMVLAVLFATISITSSCSKEETTQLPEPSADKVEISIKGEMGELECTKASVSNFITMTWTSGDKVYVYGSTDGLSITKLGELTATPTAESGNRVAGLTGTIIAPCSGTKLTLVYSTAAPSEITDSAISVDMSSQNGKADEVNTFVAYATVTYGGTTSSSYRTAFKFATSVLRVNASDLDADKELTSAAITGIETVCQLTISTDSEPAVKGITSGTVTRSFTEESTNGRGNIAFYVSLPEFSANESRYLTMKERGDTTAYSTKFVTSAQIEGKLLNTITNISTYSEGEYKGFGIYLPATGRVWAPVNCGYHARDYKYGRLYQWGRAVGGGYSGSDAGGAYQTYQQFVFKASPEAYNFYSGYTSGDAAWDWYTNSKAKQFPSWPMKSGDSGYQEGIAANPCPKGWRVPSTSELTSLYGSASGVSNGWDSTNYGFWFNGTATPNVGSGLFLPAAGDRQPNDNAFVNRGEKGWYWSKEVCGVNAYFMQFSSSVSPYIHNQARAFAGSVRCVQE